jgi:hypothetical protein
VLLEQAADVMVDKKRMIHAHKFIKSTSNVNSIAKVANINNRSISKELERIKADNVGLYEQLRKNSPRGQSTRATIRNLYDHARSEAIQITHSAKAAWRRWKKVEERLQDMKSDNSVEPATPILVSQMPAAPTALREAMDSPYWPKWLAALKKEYGRMEELKVWTIEDLPAGRKALKSKWIFSYKVDENGYVTKFKARLVAAGYSQQPGIDFKETFSSVIKIQTVRIILAMAEQYGLNIEQMDVATAFLYGELDEPNYMEMPEGFVEQNADGKPRVCKLIKSLYGLHQSSRVWGDTLTKFLTSEGFTQMKTDSCMFRKFNKKTKKTVYVLVYVDDLLLCSNCRDTIRTIKDRFKASFEMSDLGIAKYILGISIERFADGVFFGQPTYTREILEEAGMWKHETTGLPIEEKSTPMMTSWEHDSSSPFLTEKERSDFLSVLMKLAYLAQQSRPDILYAVNKLAQYQGKANHSDRKALERILRYLRGTWDYGLYYNKPRGSVLVMSNDPDLLTDVPIGQRPIGYSDASFAEEDDRKSRSGYVYMIGGAAVTWFCKKQGPVAISSTEAEYYALSEAVKEALWIRMLLTEAGFELNGPTTIMEDNKSTISIALNPVNHQRTKHIDTRVHQIRDHVKKLDVDIVYCPTGDMIADIFTKALPASQHIKLTGMLGLVSLSDLKQTSIVPASKSVKRLVY